MPTWEKDAETNACFKQVLLRPHRCKSAKECRGVGFTSCFCEPVNVKSSMAKSNPDYSYASVWRLYIAEQKTLAAQADEKLRSARMYPVLQDTTSLRQWWVPGADQGGCVHEEFLPLFCGHVAHPVDSSLRGVWLRRVEWVSCVNTTESDATVWHMRLYNEDNNLNQLRCQRLALPVHVAWLVLRFAGVLKRADGSMTGIAGTEMEATRLRELTTSQEDFAFASPGVHDLHLTPLQLLLYGTLKQRLAWSIW